MFRFRLSIWRYRLLTVFSVVMTVTRKPAALVP